MINECTLNIYILLVHYIYIIILYHDITIWFPTPPGGWFCVAGAGSDDLRRDAEGGSWVFFSMSFM
jgi:hypothetical protein